MRFMKEFLIPTAVLMVICLVVSWALVYAYNFTEPYIEKNAKREADAARIEVVPGATEFDLIKAELPDGVIEAHKDKTGKGYAFKASTKGYGGEMFIMFGIDESGKVTGAKLLENAETPGLGSKVGEPAFISTLIGKDASLSGVETIGGATISSTAFLSALRITFEAYSSITGEAIPDASAPTPAPEETKPVVDYKGALFPDIELTPIDVPEADEAYQAGDQGYLFVTSALGFYGKPLVIATAFDMNGNITNIIGVSNEETPDLGSEVSNQDYLNKYIGVQDVESIDALAGATESTGTLKSAIKTAYVAFQTASKGA